MTVCRPLEFAIHGLGRKSARIGITLVLATLALSAWSLPSHASLDTSVSRGACKGEAKCVSLPTGSTLRLHFPGVGAALDGWGWPRDGSVRIVFIESINLNAQPVVTGLVVRANGAGRFRVVMPQVGVCDFYATIHATAAGGNSLILTPPSVMCMETANPRIPVEQFRVKWGSNVRAIYSPSSALTRYWIKLSRFTGRTALTRHRAVSIARRLALVPPKAAAYARRGIIGVGLGAFETHVWEIRFRTVHVPHYGQGHEIFLIDAQAGFGAMHPGTVIASWYAP